MQPEYIMNGLYVSRHDSFNITELLSNAFLDSTDFKADMYCISVSEFVAKHTSTFHSLPLLFPLMYVLLIYTSLPCYSFSLACSILLMLLLSFDWLKHVWADWAVPYLAIEEDTPICLAWRCLETKGNREQESQWLEGWVQQEPQHPPPVTMWSIFFSLSSIREIFAHYRIEINKHLHIQCLCLYCLSFLFCWNGRKKYECPTL